MIFILNEYKTVKHQACAETVEKKSRFIASVKPVATEDEALEFLEKIKQENRTARHNVYAYIVRDNNITRYSDDGEPGGTGGVPVLEMLKKEGLTDVIVVVTRYFGGILLGTGGLVHAYSGTAKKGVDAAEICTMAMCREIFISCDYTLSGKVRFETEAFDGAFFTNTEYGEEVKFTVCVSVEKEREYSDMITDKTNAKACLTLGETRFFEKAE